jgi:hypothetical protein
MIDEVYSLINQMLHLGYTAGEIDKWISHVMGDIPIEQLNEQDCAELIDHLNSYIAYAKNKIVSL